MADDRNRWFTPNDSPAWIGLDVGGANLKGADGRGESVSVPFELWRRSDELPAALRGLLERFPSTRPVGLALTMTGELADCYATKGEGVRAIVNSAVEAAGGLPVRVAAVDDRWLSPEEAKRSPPSVAAANWRVAARLVALGIAPESGVWIDIGSTTIDAIPVTEGRVAARGETDTQRLLNGELVYTGVRRTPVCAVVDALPYRGRRCSTAAEWFATTADAWLMLGELPADPSDASTADGRPFTPAAATARLARCVCADADSFTPEDAVAAARAIAEAQAERLRHALRSVAPRANQLLVSGEGAFLAERALGESFSVVPMSQRLGATTSQTLPAHAAAVLASCELGGGV